jgi:hypothetical protein
MMSPTFFQDNQKKHDKFRKRSQVSNAIDMESKVEQLLSRLILKIKFWK